MSSKGSAATCRVALPGQHRERSTVTQTHRTPERWTRIAPMRILNARLSGQEALLDITITDGRFSAIEPSPSARSGTEAAHAGEKIVPADGRLVTPQFVDPHLHLDYANTVGQPRDNASG